MSWQEKDEVTLRKEFVIQATLEGANVADLCRRYQISRKTAYKWIKRYQESGTPGLSNGSRKPHSSPNKVPQEMIDKILQVRKKHPCWGGRTIEAALKRQGEQEVPKPSCISNILRRCGCMKEKKLNKNSFQRFEHETPNSLWQMDFKGYFSHAKGRCYPLTILDDHSRFSLALESCPNEQGETIKPKIIEVFKRYGLPDRINVDNGNPWGTSRSEARHTCFSLWLMKLGVRVSHSRPRRPQTNGKVERFHKTLKTELLDQHYFRDLEHIQQELTRWRDIYNLERPHQAIDFQVPAERYRSSYRHYKEVIDEYEYGDDYLIKRTDCRGRIAFEGRHVFIGMPFAKEWIGIRQSEKMSIMDIYFRHQKLGSFDLQNIPKGEMMNLYTGGALRT